MQWKLLFLLLLASIMRVHSSQADEALDSRLRRNALPAPAAAVAAATATKSDHSLIDNPDCQDLRTRCMHLKTTDNISILECLSAFTAAQLDKLPDKCQHAIWRQKRKMLGNKYLQEQLMEKSQSACAAQRDKLMPCTNAIDAWSCLLTRVDHFEHGNQCRKLVKRIFGVIWSDYESVGDFITACQTEIEQLECGRLQIEQRRGISQLETMQCLQENGGDEVLSGVCKSAVGRIEQQRADMELFDICANDLQRLCPQEVHGTPSAYKCLVKHKMHPSMTRSCSEHITQRDQAIAHDYRLSRGLAKACKDDIKANHCRRGVSDDKAVRLAQILLCLESVAKNGTKLTAECRGEIDDHRRMLMQDYQLSPELLSDCGDDINHFCGSDVEKIQGGGGEIIHCLMQHARVNRRKDGRVSAQCLRSIETLIKVSDAGEDWRVDPVLRQACKPVVDEVCSETDGGEARVMSCLMEHIGTTFMRPDCEQALLLIQYFVARDFKLDPQLYAHCREDAIRHCKAKRVWDDVTDAQMDPERGPLILPCLHRMAYSDSEDPRMQLSKDCYKEVKRVMRQRAISVDLIPEVEDACIEDLSKFCTDRTERGAEMECLQNNLEKLGTNCQTAVSRYTEEEAAHVELNPIIMSVCTDAMKTFCAPILAGGKDKGDMMDCLISHKNDADLRQDLKCRAAIEHFQIISLKNYHFTYKFKEACRPYVIRFCGSSTTKNEVVACLSEVMRNDTISGQRHSLRKECRQQVKSQLYQQRESLALDPKLANACKKEIQQFCADEKGPGQVNTLRTKNALECLAMNTPHLGNACHHAIFLIKKSEFDDSATDYTLVSTCKSMIYKYCENKDSVQLLDCLKKFKDEQDFDKRCHLVVVNRMIEQNTDFRFNPSLQLACGKNIDRYCSDIVAKAQPNEELNGKVVQCLKNKFRENRLDANCAKEMISILQEQALNYKLNPLLQNFCKKEINILCKQHLNEAGEIGEEHGLVEECLKQAFYNQKIINPQCKMEVATLIAEAKADIHVDPILEEACTNDLLRYCGNVKSGNGRKLKCLQIILQNESQSMEEDCRLKLQKRIEMFRNADMVLQQPPESVQQLADLVTTSPARRYLIVILMTAIGMIFIMGIFLGRVTKRAMNTKNK